MQSGLEWNEDYGNRSDVTLMLHCEADMALFAMERPVAYKAGTSLVLFLWFNKYCQQS